MNIVIAVLKEAFDVLDIDIEAIEEAEILPFPGWPNTYTVHITPDEGCYAVVNPYLGGWLGYRMLYLPY